MTLTCFQLTTIWRLTDRLERTRTVQSACVVMALIGFVCAQEGGLKTAAAVLDRYKEALGGADVIKKVQSETVRGD